jgi:peptidoglycan/xylan/chitin deacetylase (PgdA/CDA1 family)
VLLWHAVGDTPDGDPFRVAGRDFLTHLDQVLASGRTPLTAAQYAAALSGTGPLPRRPVLLTFDDGYADLARSVVPALRGRGLSATVFVTTGHLGRPGMLDVAALREIDVPGVEIGAHSVSHPHLDVLSARRARVEIRDSRTALEDLLGRSVTSFAYPHGSHSARTRQLVVDSGYATAHAVKNALSHGGDDLFAVGRYTVHAGTTTDSVAEVLAGRGAPVAWAQERPRTWAFRQVRRARQLTCGVR